MKERETFGSRLGFLLISAGCAIGLGNVWRFPYIVGQYGGAAFVLIYLFFLLIMGLPIMVMEFAVGRASRKSVICSFDELEPKGTKWHIYGWFGMIGNYMLMMFYTTVAGWLITYFIRMAKGDFVGLNSAQVEAQFGALVGDAKTQTIFMALVVVLGMAVCAKGLKNGVEKVNKVMMVCLLAILVVLAVRSVTLPGAKEGLEFYLKPNFHNLMYNAEGEYRLGEAIYAAMGQAFFTLSLGIGSIAIFGSYIGKERRLTGEAINVTLLDTFVAFVAGLIIFPAAFAFNVQPDAGPNLIFITLPNVFNAMPGGRIWGSMFFIFMSFAAMSTVTAVFENIISCCMDKWDISRTKAVAINTVLIFVLSLPCLLGFNVLSSVSIIGGGIMDFEDFILSNNLLPLGSLIYLLFCVSKRGWGYENFLAEADAGKGIKFPKALHFYFKWILPLIVLFIFVVGYNEKFGWF
ncbi:MAG: sodium-dependent transporter [Clostridia bacterium]|nr:sodium-dependent transporter [Clostridia bacterium]